MVRALWIAATGMSAQQMNIDNIANNLANVNTVGFKRSRLEFQDLLYQTIRAAGSRSSSLTALPTGLQVGHGTKSVSTHKIFSQGNMRETGNTLDLVIRGRGFFQVLLPNGETGYTRGGSFSKNAEGMIVTPEGFSLEPEMTIPPTALTIEIGTDGTVTVTEAGETEATELGQLEIADFVNPAGLKAEGGGIFMPTSASGEAMVGTPGEDGLGSIEQGFLEMSNVSVVEEMVNMIIGQRAYEINSKAITAADDMMKKVNNLLR